MSLLVGTASRFLACVVGVGLAAITAVSAVRTFAWGPGLDRIGRPTRPVARPLADDCPAGRACGGRSAHGIRCPADGAAATAGVAALMAGAVGAHVRPGIARRALVTPA